MQTDRERDHQGRDPHEQAASFRIPDRIPVFALPNVVFFPKTYLQLHIFEPRYREMVADAAAGGQCIGMALLKDGWEANYYGNPPIFKMGCVGRLVSVQPLPDGRSNILLQGLERYELRQEFHDKNYREAAIVLKPRASESALDPAVRAYLIKVLGDYLHTHEEHAHWQNFFREDVNDDLLVNTLSTHFDCTPLEKQFLLEADSLQQQARRLIDLIQFKVHERDGAKGWG
jgi:Lon protease-like protein